MGIDHGFSFPLKYFAKHRLARDWPAFLDVFQAHWPTDEDYVYVEAIREGSKGNGSARAGYRRWRRLTEICAGAKSVFYFDVPGTVAKSTHAGLPWLRYLRRSLGDRVHFWPFDGWEIPPGQSAIVEASPTLCRVGIERGTRTEDQHDAYSVAAWLQAADRDNRLAGFFAPKLSRTDRMVADIEGGIFGVPGD